MHSPYECFPDVTVTLFGSSGYGCALSSSNVNLSIDIHGASESKVRVYMYIYVTVLFYEVYGKIYFPSFTCMCVSFKCVVHVCVSV